MDLLVPGVGLIFWTLLAFLIVLFILKKFAWTPILESLNKRERTIADSLATAEKVRAEMVELKSQNEALLLEAREERALMIKEAKETSDKMISGAKEKAKNEYDRICPATIFANNLIINATGFINIPANSTGIKINLTKNGTPGGQKIWPQ